MSNDLERLGKNISRNRERKGLTQVEFAAAVGVKQGTISAWEKGKIDIPYTTLCRIAEKLGTSPASLADPDVAAAGSYDRRKLLLVEAILRASNETEVTALEGVALANSLLKARKARPAL